MKKILLASTALVASAGFAAAEVVVGGDGYFGVGYGKATDGIYTTTRLDSDGEQDSAEYSFVYDLDIDFAVTLQSDSGLSFGMKTDLDDNAGDSQGATGHEGEIFISGDFGRLAMGDISGAAEAIVGDLAGVGLTGLGDFNEAIYLFDARPQPAGPVARYDYSVSGVKLSLGLNDDEGYSVGAGYATDLFSVGLGYESVRAGTRVTLIDSDLGPIVRSNALAEDATHIIGTASVTFSGVKLAAVYGQADLDERQLDGADQYGISASSSFGAVSVSAYYRVVDLDYKAGTLPDNKYEGYGIGAEYDLGGGLSLAAGIAQVDSDFVGGTNTKTPDSLTVADFGVAINF